eukprot:1537731-Pyramimonas_sp.AAC.1
MQLSVPPALVVRLRAAHRQPPPGSHSWPRGAPGVVRVGLDSLGRSQHPSPGATERRCRRRRQGFETAPDYSG